MVSFVFENLLTADRYLNFVEYYFGGLLDDVHLGDQTVYGTNTMVPLLILRYVSDNFWINCLKGV